MGLHAGDEKGLFAPLIVTRRGLEALPLRVPHTVLDALDVPPAEALDLTVEFEIASNLLVVEDSEAVDDGDGASGPAYDIVWFEIEILGVTDSEDNSVYVLQGRRQILKHTQVFELLLVPEEPCPAVPGPWVDVLFLELPPVRHVWIVDPRL